MSTLHVWLPRVLMCVCCACLSLLASCGDDKSDEQTGRPNGGDQPPYGVPPAGLGSPGNDGGYGTGGYGTGGYGTGGQITFAENVRSNVASPRALTELPFTDVDGKQRKLSELLGERHLVVVMVRGQAIQGGELCPFCTTQTSRLITNYDQFKQRNAEVVVVYPLATGRNSAELTNFLARSKQMINQPGAQTPFPIWLDVDLKAVDQLGLREELARPTTYILDKQGRVRFAYVGQNLADRPSIKAMLAQLEALN